MGAAPPPAAVRLTDRTGAVPAGQGHGEPGTGAGLRYLSAPRPAGGYPTVVMHGLGDVIVMQYDRSTALSLSSIQAWSDDAVRETGPEPRSTVRMLRVPLGGTNCDAHRR
ncbi:hypothetical protein ACFYNM_17605 [Streptomyces spororaveus]|uniref:hypothetical protein n=1 Tax=Streptomyces spororaveus TaxID=284039 RepID=UPI0036A80303